jgi:hypothetical protein
LLSGCGAPVTARAEGKWEHETAERTETAGRERSVTKRYDEPIEVTSDPFDDGAPLTFRWRGRLYEIDRRLSSWREAGEWWAGNGSATNGNGRRARDREYHRVLARPAGLYSGGDIDADGFMTSVGAVYDVYRDRVSQAWKLARVWD